MKFKLGLGQCCHPADKDIPKMVESFAADAKSQGVDILAFPESLMTSYETEIGRFLEDAQPLDGPFTQAIDSIAKHYGLWMVYTVNELNPDGKPFNTVVITNSDGRRVGFYRKTHLFDTDFTKESDRMSCGDRLFEPVETPFGKIGLAICYDLRFPEIARKMALEGCALLLYPAAWVDGAHKADQWKTLLKARAIENEMFVAGICRADEGYIGQSCIIDPLGRIVASGGTTEALVVAELDTTVMDDIRSRMPVFAHRKPNLY